MDFNDSLRNVFGALQQTFSPENYHKEQELEAQKAQAKQAQVQKFTSEIDQATQAGSITPEQRIAAYQQTGITNPPPMGPSTLTQNRTDTLQQNQQELVQAKALSEKLAPTIAAMPDSPQKQAMSAMLASNDPKQVAEVAKSLAAPKEMKRSAYAQQLVDEGLPADSPQFKQRMNEFNTAELLRKQAIAVSHSFKELTPEQNDALTKAVEEGRVDANRVNNRTAPLFANILLQSPGINMAGLSADIALARNPSFRQKALTAETLPTIISSMVDAGKKIDFSDNRTVGKFQAFMKGEFNDPDFREYMSLRNDALMTITTVMRQIGMSDYAIKQEIEAAPTEMNPNAFDAWAKGQMKALEPRIKLNEKIINKGNASKPDPLGLR